MHCIYGLLEVLFTACIFVLTLKGSSLEPHILTFLLKMFTFNFSFLIIEIFVELNRAFKVFEIISQVTITSSVYIYAVSFIFFFSFIANRRRW